MYFFCLHRLDKLIIYGLCVPSYKKFPNQNGINDEQKIPLMTYSLINENLQFNTAINVFSVKNGVKEFLSSMHITTKLCLI